MVNNIPLETLDLHRSMFSHVISRFIFVLQSDGPTKILNDRIKSILASNLYPDDMWDQILVDAGNPTLLTIRVNIEQSSRLAKIMSSNALFSRPTLTQGGTKLMNYDIAPNRFRHLINEHVSEYVSDSLPIKGRILHKLQELGELIPLDTASKYGEEAVRSLSKLQKIYSSIV